MQYTYSTVTDTLNAQLNSTTLSSSIAASSIVTSLDRIDTEADSIKIYFTSNLSTQDELTLTGLVNSHDGVVTVTEIQPLDIILPSFTDKHADGKSIYNRTEGKSQLVSIGSNDIYFTIPYPLCKFTGVEILNGELGDKVDLWVLDTVTGTITTIPNYPLNQFGKDVNIAKDFYKRESSYDADLFAGLQVWIKYTSLSTKTIYVNFVIHELK